jgi:nuclear pore complex protein Nup54
MVPVLATGWKDVKKRVEMQEQTASVHQQRIKELNQALANLSRQTSLSSSVRLQALQTQLAQLTQRLLALAAKSPSFAPVQSSAFRPEEGEMKHTLEEVKDALDGRAKPARGVGLSTARPANKGRMLGQVNELWGLVEEVRRQRRARGHDAQAWAGDEKLLTEIAIVLDQQQAALTKLSELASDNVFDADVMRAGLAAVEKK